MKKYYDAMYKAFYEYHNLFYITRNVPYAIKVRLVERLYAELSGVSDVACCDDDVSSGEEFNILLDLRTNLYDVAKAYFLKE